MSAISHDLQVLADPRAMEYVDGIGMHWYADSAILPNTSPLEKLHRNYPSKFIMYTEACNGRHL